MLSKRGLGVDQSDLSNYNDVECHPVSIADIPHLYPSPSPAPYLVYLFLWAPALRYIRLTLPADSSLPRKQ